MSSVSDPNSEGPSGSGFNWIRIRNTVCENDQFVHKGTAHTMWRLPTLEEYHRQLTNDYFACRQPRLHAINMLTAKSADRSINHVGCHVLLTSKEKYRYHLIMNNEPPTGFYIFLVFKILPYGTVFSKLLVAVWRIRIRGICIISLDPDPHKKWLDPDPYQSSPRIRNEFFHILNPDPDPHWLVVW